MSSIAPKVYENSKPRSETTTTVENMLLPSTRSFPPTSRIFSAETSKAPFSLSSSFLDNISKFDTFFIIDDTPSMTVPSRSDDPGNQTCWEVLTNALKHATEMEAIHHLDGIGLRFLKARHLDETHVKTTAELMHILAHIDLSDGTHAGGTELLKPLTELVDWKLVALRNYNSDRAQAAPDHGEDNTGPELQSPDRPSISRKPPKHLNLIVMTDGNLDDEDEVRDYLVQVSRELDRLRASYAAVGIVIVQIGDCVRARDYLGYLGDELGNREVSPRNILDVVSLNDFLYRRGIPLEQAVKKVLVGEIDSG